MPPAGALNRCRPYVPARVLWGAVTAEISRSRNGESFPAYSELGKEVGENCRFTYLYPAEKRRGKLLVWMPKFEKMRGIQWYCHGGEESLSDRDFRRRLLDSRSGTAIAPESDSASEGTLRETECIKPWWNDSDNRGESNAMMLLGYVFLRDNLFRTELDKIKTIFIGGDTRYGLGKICRVEWHEVSRDLSIFGKQVHLDREHPEIQSNIVWGHALESGQSQIHGMQGTKEILGGWDQDRPYKPYKGELSWSPGSFLESSPIWSLLQNGFWQVAGDSQ